MATGDTLHTYIVIDRFDETPFSENSVNALFGKMPKESGTVLYRMGLQPQIGDLINNGALTVVARVVPKPGTSMDRLANGLILLVR